MSEIITYNNSPSGKYCQIKFDDGQRVLISLAQSGIKVFKLKFGGTIPWGTVFEISTQDLFSDKYKSVRKRLTQKSVALDMLDVFKEILTNCKSLDEAKTVLDTIFKL